jgi:hypothetical protein
MGHPSLVRFLDEQEMNSVAVVTARYNLLYKAEYISIKFLAEGISSVLE